jgi:hypothetical protein
MIFFLVVENDLKLRPCCLENTLSMRSIFLSTYFGIIYFFKLIADDSHFSFVLIELLLGEMVAGCSKTV